MLGGSSHQRCKLKPQWAATSHLSEWPSSINQQTASAGEAVEKGDPRALSRGMQTGAATVGNRVEFLPKTKNGSAFSPSGPTSGNISKETPNTTVKAQKHPCVHSRVIYSCRATEAARCPWVDEWVEQLWGRNLHHGMLLGCRKEGDFTYCDNMDGPGKSLC